MHSQHAQYLVPDKSMLWVLVRWLRDKAGCESQKFRQVSAVHELPIRLLIHSWNPSVYYVAHSLSVESQKFRQVSAVHELLARPLIHSWNSSVYYIAHNLSVELIPV